MFAPFPAAAQPQGPRAGVGSLAAPSDLTLDIFRRSVTGLSPAKELEDLEARFNAYISAFPESPFNRVIVVDPDKFDIATALGMTATEYMLHEHGITVSEKNRAKISSEMHDMRKTIYGHKAYFTRPQIFSEQGGVCILLPAVSSAIRTGLFQTGIKDPAAWMGFINEHEAVHCKDGEYDTRKIDPNIFERTLIYDLPAVLADLAAQAAILVYNKSESLADVTAIGNLIRAGKDPIKLVETVRSLRNEVLYDFIHLTTPALDHFMRRLDETGMEKFIRMTEAEARDFYSDVVRTGAISGAVYKSLLSYQIASKEQKLQFEKDAEKDPLKKQALDFFRNYLDIPAAPNTFTGKEAHLDVALKQFDPLQALSSEALSHEGQITPETVLRAYARVQASLRHDISAGVDLDLNLNKSIMLRGFLIDRFKTLNFSQKQAHPAPAPAPESQ